MAQLKPVSRAKTNIAFVNNINNAAWTLALTIFWTGITAFNIYKEVIFTGDHIHLGLQSHIQAEEGDSLNKHLESSARLLKKRDLLTPNTILVVNESGIVTSSTVKAWTNLSILDPIFGQGVFSNENIEILRKCVSLKFECNDKSITGYRLSTNTMSGIYKLNYNNKASHDGISAERSYLIIVFDKVQIISFLTNSVIIGFFVIGIIVVLISIVPYIYVSRVTLPFVYRSLQKDSLTNLNNRSIFTEQALVKLEKAEIRQDPYTLVILDIDNFKKINDAYGHIAGDLALTEYGLIIAQSVKRTTDLSSRFGGEEFALLIQTNKHDCTPILERLRLQFEMHEIRYHEETISTTLSIGAASTVECGYNFDYLLMKADEALYNAKREGKNQIQWHENSLLIPIN